MKIRDLIWLVALVAGGSSAVASVGIVRHVFSAGGSGTATSRYALRTTHGQAIAGRAGSTSYGIASGFREARPDTTTLLSTHDPSGPFPEQFRLHPNTPNPFNPVTKIRYDVPPPGGTVRLRVYAPSGRLVRTLVNGDEQPGYKSVRWAGRDDHGSPVASGIYFIRFEADAYVKTHRMVLVR